jgi:hypothetical protein
MSRQAHQARSGSCRQQAPAPCGPPCGVRHRRTWYSAPAAAVSAAAAASRAVSAWRKSTCSSARCGYAAGYHTPRDGVWQCCDRNGVPCGSRGCVVKPGVREIVGTLCPSRRNRSPLAVSGRPRPPVGIPAVGVRYPQSFAVRLPRQPLPLDLVGCDRHAQPSAESQRHVRPPTLVCHVSALSIFPHHRRHIPHVYHCRLRHQRSASRTAR